MSAVTVPAGFVLVPVEPTPAMVDAGERAYLAMIDGTAEAGWMEQVIYRAMIAARPAITAGTDAGAAETNTGEWSIDTSTGTEILVFNKCSVIEDAQARYVLRLLADQRGSVSKDVAALVVAARAIAYEDLTEEARASLDEAVEVFAERVAWECDDEIATAPNEHGRVDLAALTPETAEAVPVAAQPGEALRKVLEKISDEASKANDVIRLNRDGRGQGRVRVAVAIHRIVNWSRAALSQPKEPRT